MSVPSSRYLRIFSDSRSCRGTRFSFTFPKGSYTCFRIMSRDSKNHTIPTRITNPTPFRINFATLPTKVPKQHHWPYFNVTSSFRRTSNVQVEAATQDTATAAAAAISARKGKNSSELLLKYYFVLWRDERRRFRQHDSAKPRWVVLRGIARGAGWNWRQSFDDRGPYRQRALLA